MSNNISNNISQKFPKTALISVSNKEGVVDLAKELVKLDIKILSTGGTAKLLSQEGVDVTLVSDVTKFPEIMGGRVKTLHPKVHGGILGKRDQHQAEADEHGIGWIDLVIVNLYPFAETVAKGESFEKVIEQIDIGGPCMIRAAAKNHKDVGIIVDPSDYSNLVGLLQDKEICLDNNSRIKFAQKAFAHTADYDRMINDYFMNKLDIKLDIKFDDSHFLDKLESFKKISELRYGENPHQKSSLYKDEYIKSGSLLQADQLQGKDLSYNNYLDTDAALQTLSDFTGPACVIVKHANPCGVALGESIDDAFADAWAGDPKSAFGGIIALNRECSEEIAKFLASVFVEVIVAPSFSDSAKEILSKKSNLRLLKLKIDKNYGGDKVSRNIYGGALKQDSDKCDIHPKDCEVVTKVKPDNDLMRALIFSYRVVRHVKSNAIVISNGVKTLGVGPGQVSRVDAVEIAIKKAKDIAQDDLNLSNAVLASDAFFPFPDSIELIAKQTNIKAIIQPGGSIKDQAVIDECDKHGIAMVFTGKRVFKH